MVANKLVYHGRCCFGRNSEPLGTVKFLFFSNVQAKRRTKGSAHTHLNAFHLFRNEFLFSVLTTCICLISCIVRCINLMLTTNSTPLVVITQCAKKKKNGMKSGDFIADSHSVFRIMKMDTMHLFAKY